MGSLERRKVINQILLIDDDEDLLFLAKKFLKRKNIDVITSNSGLTGLEKFNSIKDKLDLVILDHSFKNSDLQGKEILRKIKEIKEDTIVIMSSGYPETYFKETYPEDLFKLIDGFLDKAYSSPDFIEKLEMIYNS